MLRTNGRKGPPGLPMMEKTPVMFNDGGRGTVARMILAQTTTTAAPDGGASGLADLLAATLPTESRLVVAWSAGRIDGGLSHTGNAPHEIGRASGRTRGRQEVYITGVSGSIHKKNKNKS